MVIVYNISGFFWLSHLNKEGFWHWIFQSWTCDLITFKKKNSWLLQIMHCIRMWPEKKFTFLISQNNYGNYEFWPLEKLLLFVRYLTMGLQTPSPFSILTFALSGNFEVYSKVYMVASISHWYSRSSNPLVPHRRKIVTWKLWLLN